MPPPTINQFLGCSGIIVLAFIAFWIWAISANNAERQAESLVHLSTQCTDEIVAFTVNDPSGDRLVIWDRTTSEPRHIIPLPGTAGTPVLSSEGSQILVTVYTNDIGQVIQVNFKSGEISKTTFQPLGIAATQGDILISANSTAMRGYSMGGQVPTDVIVQKHNLMSDTEPLTIGEGYDLVNSVSIQDDLLVYTARSTGKLNQEYELYNLRTGEKKHVDTDFPIHRLHLYNGGTYAMTYEPGTQPYAYGFYRLHNLETDPKLGECVAPFQRIGSYSISPDGNTIFIWGTQKPSQPYGLFQVDISTGTSTELLNTKTIKDTLNP